MSYKMAIIVRADLKLPKGKMSAQCSHASVEATLRSDKDKVKKWRNEGMAKIVLKVPDLNSLKKYNQLAKDMKLTTALITDSGKTTVQPGTITCLAIGPDEDKLIDNIIHDLKLM